MSMSSYRSPIAIATADRELPDAAPAPASAAYPSINFNVMLSPTPPAAPGAAVATVHTSGGSAIDSDPYRHHAPAAAHPHPHPHGSSAVLRGLIENCRLDDLKAYLEAHPGEVNAGDCSGFHSSRGSGSGSGRGRSNGTAHRSPQQHATDGSDSPSSGSAADNTPLGIAAQGGQLAVVSILVQQFNADVDVQDSVCAR